MVSLLSAELASMDGVMSDCDSIVTIHIVSTRLPIPSPTATLVAPTHSGQYEQLLSYFKNNCIKSSQKHNDTNLCVF